MAQSALSKHVIELEAQLGLRLLDRLPTGVRLTQAGQIYAEDARRSLEMMERAGLRAQRAAKGEIDQLTLAMNDIGARNLDIARWIANFSGRYPNVQLDFISMTSQQQLAALHHNKIDAGIIIERPDNAALSYQKLATEPFFIALPRDHALADMAEVPVEALHMERFVSVAINTYWLTQTRLFARCRELGFMPQIVQEASNDYMQMSFIAAGMGIGFVNVSSNWQFPHHIVTRPVRDLNIAVELDLVWLNANTRPSLRHLVDMIRS